MKQRYAIYGSDSNIIGSDAYIRSYNDSDLDAPEKIKNIIDMFWNSKILLTDESYKFKAAYGKNGAILCFAKSEDVIKTYGIILPETHPSFNNLITLLVKRRNSSKTPVTDIWAALDKDYRYFNYRKVVRDSIFP
jgi:hypothetical protein